ECFTHSIDAFIHVFGNSIKKVLVQQIIQRKIDFCRPSITRQKPRLHVALPHWGPEPFFNVGHFVHILSSSTLRIVPSPAIEKERRFTHYRIPDEGRISWGHFGQMNHFMKSVSKMAADPTDLLRPQLVQGIKEISFDSVPDNLVVVYVFSNECI